MTQTNKSGDVAALKLKGIKKTYGVGDNRVEALKGIDITFRKNEFVSILGPSGCGKTTMLNIIGGLDRYSSGDLIINGVSTKCYKDADWDTYRNNSIGFVFQSYNLISHQSVMTNVELALTLSGVGKHERKRRVKEVLKKVGLADQAHKLPNQMSGGQMQRVAIARALINDPDIILADEPTGALDTETSIQIMELLKEVAKDRLVVMVTHNPELAQKYSTRIITLLDGEKTGDTNPFDGDFSPEPKNKEKGKAAMRLGTAFSLSLSNLKTKRGRTVLTSIAGSIGIIGIALVLAVSTGFSAYMSRMQTDTLATYPLTISESSVDLSSFSERFDGEIKEKYPELDNVLIEKSFHKLTGMLKSNNLSDTSDTGFLAYLDKLDSEYYYAVSKSYGFDMNDYFYTDITLNGESSFVSIDYVVNGIEASFEEKLQSAMGLSTDFVRQYIPTIQEMPDKELIETQYDVLTGRLPDFTDASANEMVLVVNSRNGVSDITMMLLGYVSGSYNAETNEFEFEKGEDGNQITELDIEDVLNKKFYLANNDAMYNRVGNDFYYTFNQIDKTKLEELKIVGVIRAKEDVEGVLSTGLAYTPELTAKVIAQNKNSEIATAAAESGYASIMMPNPSAPTNPVVYETLTLRRLAGVDTPSEISIYARDFECKEAIKAYIDKWNDGLPEGDADTIAYSDMMSMVFTALNTMVDAVTYVLVAFTSISLVVSSIMIGIITYVSVVERTKEIGILRSIGARKKDISRIFNAETFLIGLFAGIIGVGVTYLLSVPINFILGRLVSGIGNVAVLKITDAAVLVAISFILTLVAGLIPSGIAAKKDPVEALRSE